MRKKIEIEREIFFKVQDSEGDRKRGGPDN